MPSTTALEIPAAMIRLFLATTLATARIPSGRRLGMTAWAIRSEWRAGRSGSVVVTWTRETAYRQGTSSEWQGFLVLIVYASVRATHEVRTIIRLMLGS